MQSPLLALNDRVIVRVDVTTQTAGGVIVPDSAQEALVVLEGVVLDVGPLVEPANASLLHPGIRVRFNKYSGLQADQQDESLRSIAVTDLLGIVPAAAAATNQLELPF